MARGIDSFSSGCGADRTGAGESSRRDRSASRRAAIDAGRSGNARASRSVADRGRTRRRSGRGTGGQAGREDASSSADGVRNRARAARKDRRSPRTAGARARTRCIERAAGCSDELAFAYLALLRTSWRSWLLRGKEPRGFLCASFLGRCLEDVRGLDLVDAERIAPVSRGVPETAVFKANGIKPEWTRSGQLTARCHKPYQWQTQTAERFKGRRRLHRATR